MMMVSLRMLSWRPWHGGYQRSPCLRAQPTLDGFDVNFGILKGACEGVHVVERERLMVL